MKKCAVVFPGQGSQHVGMGKDFLKDERFSRYIDEADNVLSFKLSKLIFEGPEDELTLTQNAQPAIFTVSYGIFQYAFEYLKDKFEFFLGGHSLGEYTALSCAGAISFSDCVNLVRLRGKFMQEAVPEGHGGMIALVSSREKVEQEIKNFENVWIANINSQEQVVVSGRKDSIDQFADHMRKKGIRVIPLKVSAPFHCPLMYPARMRLQKVLETIQINKLNFKVLSAHTLEYYSVENVKNTLLDGITSEVNFYGFVRKLHQDESIDIFIEIGPGKVLSSLIRRILPNAKIITVNGPVGLEQLKDL